MEHNPTIDCLLERRSIRRYRSMPVRLEDLMKIIECGSHAPTTFGRQAWHFTLIQNRDFMDEITEANRELMLASGDARSYEVASREDFDAFRGAPCGILVSGLKDDRESLIDCANAMTNMTVAAKALGLGSCYLGVTIPALRSDQYPNLRSRLNLPDGYEPQFVLAVGYADEAPEADPRKENLVTIIN